MYGLIDCNNFFVSCERVFRPDLAQKPVVVMSNNDGCAVAMSNEAKALGITRGVPVYQVKQIIQRYNITTLSGNHRLYGDMSSRVMATIASIVPEIEIYSIDECFINFSAYPKEQIEMLGRNIVKCVRRNVGIPTSLGIAPTKTLAKVAARFAKKFPGYRGVCFMDCDEKRRKALSLTEITDIWGIGRKLGKTMRGMGVDTALQFADMPIEKVRRMLNIVSERTWRELNGEPCIDVEPDESEQKQMCCTRSFTTSMTDIEQLREAVAYFCDNLGRKLRERGLCAETIGIFIQTNPHRTDQPQYYGNTYHRLEEATNDTLILTSEVCKMLHAIYRKGYGYKRAGVMITEMVKRGAVQQSLFTDSKSRQRNARLMNVIDHLNHSDSTNNSIHIATVPAKRKIMRQEAQSPLYSTHLSDIIIIGSKK